MRALLSLRSAYHVRKPRVLSENDLSYLNYKKRLREARRQVHQEAYEYQEKIENDYLLRHREEMKAKHFERQCSFRKACFFNAYSVFQKQKQWKKDNEVFEAKLNKHLHDEDIKKINRSRILKIMQHESANYWFNA